MNHVSIDFELYYDKEISIKTMGVDAYVRHPSAEPYLVSVYEGYGDQLYVGHPSDFDWGSIEGMTWVSHNRTFDKRVYDHLVELKLVDDVKCSTWECTADLSVYLRCPRNLKGACKFLLEDDGIVISKDIRRLASGIWWEDMPLYAVSDKGKLVLIEKIPNYSGPTFWDLMLEYSGNDAKAPWYIWKKWSGVNPDTGKLWWPEQERRLSRMTTEQCHRGFLVDRKRLEGYIQTLQRVKNTARLTLPWSRDSNDEEGILSIKKLKEAIKAEDIVPPETTSEDSEECRKWEAEHPEIPWIQIMRGYRKANILQRRMEVILKRIMPNGRFPYSMLYGGAHTLRWSGGSSSTRGGVGETGFNVQNFPKEPLYITENYTVIEDLTMIENIRRDPKAYRAKAIDLRSCVIAPPGKKICVCDLAQIEPRIIRWLCEDWETLELIKQGMSIYEVHARKTMGWTGGNIKKEDPHQQFIAKQRVLSLGYQCGGEKFSRRCAEFGVDISLQAAKKIVQDFRHKDPTLVRKWWNRLDAQFKGAEGEDYDLELPNGRILRYFGVKKFVKSQTNGDGKTYPDSNKDRPGSKFNALRSNLVAQVVQDGPSKFFYGGLLFENFVQGTARDIFAEGLLACEDAGHTILFHVSDEVVLEVDEGVTAAEIEKLMSVSPEWAAGLPVGAEAHIGKCYHK